MSGVGQLASSKKTFGTLREWRSLTLRLGLIRQIELWAVGHGSKTVGVGCDRHMRGELGQANVQLLDIRAEPLEPLRRLRIRL